MFLSGDRCKLKATVNGIGVCRYIEDCYSVFRDVDKHKKQPQLCGFDGHKPIVCCSDPDPSSNQSSGVNQVPDLPELITVTSTTASPSGTPSGALDNRNTNNLAPMPNVEPNREYLTPFNDIEADCDRFSEAVFEYINIPGSDGTVRHTLREARCTTRRDDEFTGRKVCEAKEFPHMVLIGADSTKGAKYFCSGTLISNQYVLTAAHCIHNTGAQYVKMVADKDEYYIIEESIPYPEYKNTSFYHDIGLIKLHRQVTYSPYLRPACLPTAPITQTWLNHIMTSTWERSPTSGTRFVKVRLNQMPTNECTKDYQHLGGYLENGIKADSQICVKMNQPEEVPCPIGVGGPLQIIHPQAYCSYLVFGVSSFAKTCGFSEAPVVFTNVVKYMDWIQTIVWGKKNV